jgi:SulP family sulfate permease
MNQPPVNDAISSTNAIVRRIAAVMPIISWLPRYQTAWLWSDLIAGLTLAAYSVPVAMAYASLAGLTPQVGIYCYIFGGIVYAVFSSSRHLSVGPTAAISVMVASVVGAMAGGDMALYASIAAMTAGIVALISIMAWLLRLSTFVNFISETILLGFKAGAALSIIVTQLPKLFGVTGGGNGFFERLFIFARQLGDTNLTVLVIGIGALVFLLVGERMLPERPVALAVLLISIAVVSEFDLAGHGVKVVGLLPQGMPKLGLPKVGLQHAEGLLELAFACFLLSYIESISAARTFAQKHHYYVNPQQELLALGMANLVTAFGQGYPVGGGLSQSAVNEGAGARTPMSLIVASVTLSTALLFLTGLLRNLPDAVLAAIVIAAVSGFIKISEFDRLRDVSRFEFHVAMVAFVGVLLFGILKGVLISAVASVLMLLRLMANPHVAVLGRIPGTQRFSDVERHPDNELISGIFLFRVEAALLYFNVENIGKTVLELVHVSDTPVRLVVCDLSTSPYIDASGAQMLAQLQRQLASEGIGFRVADAHAEVRDILRASGVDQQLGGVSRYTSIPDIINEFGKRQV